MDYQEGLAPTIGLQMRASRPRTLAFNLFSNYTGIRGIRGIGGIRGIRGISCTSM